MRKLIEFFVERSVLVNLISVMVIISGVISAYFLQKETFPNISFDVVIIRTIYPGSSAEDVEKLVSIPIERSLKAVDGIKEINAMSGEGMSIVYLEIEADYILDDVITDIRDAIDAIDDFPIDVESPFISRLENKSRPVIKIALYGLKPVQLRDLAKEAQEVIEDVQGVTNATISGYKNEIMDVALDPLKLQNLEVTVGEVTTAIKNRNLNLTAGSIKTFEKNFVVRTVSEFQTAAEIANIVVRSNPSGRKVRVGDLGTVDHKLEDNDLEERANGQDAIFLDVKIQEHADIINVTDEVKSTIENFIRGQKIDGLKFMYSDDMSFYVKRRLNVLTANGIQGMILVFVCLMLFMNLRVSLVTGLGVPIAFATSFMLMDSFGISINLISMFAMILVLGMLVDDAIIVAEQFFQHVEKGVPTKEAAIRAATETVKPVAATVLTTMAAFAALFFMGGIMGKFIWSVPAVVIICLFASWVECFFILPSHLCDFVKAKKGNEEKRWYQPLYGFYGKVLDFCLRHYKMTIITFGLLFVLCVGLAVSPLMKVEMFPSGDITIMFLNIKGSVGTPFEKTNEAMRKAEDIVLKSLREDEFDQARSVVGWQLGEHEVKTGTHYGAMILYLRMPDLRKRTNEEIIDGILPNLKKEIVGFDISLRKIQHGPPKGKALNINLYGDDLKQLLSVARKVKERASTLAGVTTTEIDFEEGKKQLLVMVDDDESRRLGITSTQIAFELRRAYQGDAVTEIRRSDEDVDIRVRLKEDARRDVKQLLNIYIMNDQGRRIRLGQVAKISEEDAAFMIRRTDRKRAISVLGEIDPSITTSNVVNKLMEPYVKEVLLENQGLTYKLGGEKEDTNESFGRLAKAGIIALFCIFIILVAMFGSLLEPAIIMSAIPFGMIGVVLTFFTMRLPFSFMALLGIIGLVGVVVNDSIVLVTFINKQLEDFPDDPVQAIRNGALSRFRAVILTTFTTVASLLPLAHSSSGDPFLKPMALSFAYGLTFSSTITLLFIPAAFFAYYRFIKFVDRMKVRWGLQE